MSFLDTNRFIKQIESTKEKKKKTKEKKVKCMESDKSVLLGLVSANWSFLVILLHMLAGGN